MHRDGHVGAALLAFAPVGFTLTAADAPGLAGLGAAGAIALSMLPDYDARTPGLKHRGFTHTLLFVPLAGVAMAVATDWFGATAGVSMQGTVQVYGYAVASLGRYAGFVTAVTVLSHIAADALTPAGIPLLWPLSEGRFSLEVANADSTLANYGLLLAGASATLWWGYPLLVGAG